MTNGLSHPYHLGESIFILGALRVFFIFVSFFDEIHVSKLIAPDGTLRFAASHLELFCLPMSNENDARLIWVNVLQSARLKNNGSGFQSNMLRDVASTCVRLLNIVQFCFRSPFSKR